MLLGREGLRGPSLDGVLDQPVELHRAVLAEEEVGRRAKTTPECPRRPRDLPLLDVPGPTSSSTQSGAGLADRARWRRRLSAQPSLGANRRTWSTRRCRAVSTDRLVAGRPSRKPGPGRQVTSAASRPCRSGHLREGDLHRHRPASFDRQRRRARDRPGRTRTRAGPPHSARRRPAMSIDVDPGTPCSRRPCTARARLVRSLPRSSSARAQSPPGCTGRVVARVVAVRPHVGDDVRAATHRGPGHRSSRRLASSLASTSRRARRRRCRGRRRFAAAAASSRSDICRWCTVAPDRPAGHPQARARAHGIRRAVDASELPRRTGDGGDV